MNQLQSILDQAKVFVEQQVPGDLLAKAVPLGIVCVLAGVGMCVFGAKLARFSVTGGFAAAGGYVGYLFAQHTAYPTIVCVLGGAVMVAVVAYHTFRLWVGVAAAVMLSSLSLGLFGYQRMLPHLDEFEQRTTWSAQTPGNFSLPSSGAQEANRERTFPQWLREFWGFVSQKDVQLERNGKALSIAAMLTGLCVGVLAMRAALIVSTSMFGTMLLTTGVFGLLAQSAPGAYQTLHSRPDVMGMVMGGFLVGSIILQTLLTRSASKKEANVKS